MPACPHCGQSVAESDTRCPHCGGALSAARSSDDGADATLLRTDAGRGPASMPGGDDRTLIPGFESGAPAGPRDTASDSTLVPAAGLAVEHTGASVSSSPARGELAEAGARAASASAAAGGASAAVVDDGDGPTITCATCDSVHEPGDACPACGALNTPTSCDEHPDRTAHSRCVLCGRAVCERDADEGRRPTTCPEHRNVPVIEGWAQVFSTATEMEAQLLAENLRSEGIDSTIYNQGDRIFPVDLGELSIHRLMVPVWEYGQALDLIRGYMDTRGEVVFACPSCGEVYEPGQEACSACGASLTE
jgi:hypothetical protein